jgi:orotidine-5'-phosphate decarboxylase
MNTPHASDRLIVALDFDSLEQAKRLVGELDGTATFFKVGMGLQLDPGMNGFIRELIASGKRVFLDYKYFDIEATVERAVSQASKIGVSFLTVHGNSSIIQAAVRGRAASEMKVFAVTVLTSLDAEDIKEMGFDCSVEELVLHRASQAVKWGCDGVIASGREAILIRERVGNGLLVVTPGIRPGGYGTDDQKRTMTPGQAIEAGADYLVVGRPITGASNPRQAAAEIVAEIEEALTRRSNAQVRNPQ